MTRPRPSLVITFAIRFCYYLSESVTRINPASHHIPEADLVRRLLEKDKAALEYLYDHYAPAIYSVILRVVRKEAIAEEAVQDVFLKYWNKIETYDASKGKLFTWMLNIARNHAIDRTRSREIIRETKTDGMDNFVHTGKTGGSEELAVDAIGLKEVLHVLTNDQQIVIDYLYFRGYSQSELSEELGIPLGTVKTRLRLAMQQLRIILAES